MLTNNLQQIGELLAKDKQFLQAVKTAIQKESYQSKNESANLNALIEEIKNLLYQLIQQQLQNELRQIIEDNNRILKQVQASIIKSHEPKKLHQIQQDVSFTEVHKLMSEQRKKLAMAQQINDASLERSISAFVQLKVQTIEQRVVNIDQRLKSMEDKYETNLKSIWNVLSITESALFDHLKQCKGCQKAKKQNPIQEEGSQQKKSFFGFFKTGK